MPRRMPQQKFQWTLLPGEADVNHLRDDIEATINPPIMTVKHGSKCRLNIAPEKGSIHRTTSITSIRPEHLKDNILYIPPSISFKRRLTHSSDCTKDAKGSLLVSYTGGAFCIPGVSLADDGKTVSVYTVDHDGMKKRGFTLDKQTGLLETKTPGMLAWRGANIQKMERYTDLHPSHADYKSTNSSSTAASHQLQLLRTPTGPGSSDQESTASQYGCQHSLENVSEPSEGPDGLLAAMIDCEEDDLTRTGEQSENFEPPSSHWSEKPIGFTPINSG